MIYSDSQLREDIVQHIRKAWQQKQGSWLVTLHIHLGNSKQEVGSGNEAHPQGPISSSQALSPESTKASKTAPNNS